MNVQLLTLRSLFTSVGSIHFATAALGTLVALRVSDVGGSQEAASLVASSYSLGFLIGCFFIGGPLLRIGHIRAFAAAAALCTMATLSLTLSDSIGAMLLARFVTGLATAGLYAIGDAWINDTAGPEVRGRTLAIYSVVLGVASIASQFGVAAVVHLERSFVLTTMFFSLAIVVLTSTRTAPPASATKAVVRIKATLRESPTAVTGAFINGMVVTLLLNVFPFRMSELGIGTATIALVIGAVYVGRVLFQIPLGRASDRIDRRLVILAVTLVCGATLVVLAFLASGRTPDPEAPFQEVPMWLVLGLMVILGGAVLTLYSLLTAHAMDRTVPVYVASTAVTLLFVYTLGGVMGPLLAGATSAVFGDRSTTWFMAVVTLAHAVFAFYQMRHRDAPEQAERARHVPGGATSVEMTPVSKR
ncbi:MFS transporter [Halovulum sp. GXIMD14794]